MAIEIREHQPGKDLDAFIRAPFDIFKGDPQWVPPLEMDIRDRLSPAKNPFFEHAEGTLFTAWEGSRLVGRISAQIDQEHLRIHQDGAGFFGFFDTIEDPRVAKALVDAATEWNKARGMQRIRGPMSLSINEEMGTLVEGFDTPPMIMMPHSRPYQGRMAEAAGLTKCKDLFAWKYDAGHIPPRAQKAWDAVQEMPEVQIRSVRKADMESELRIIMDVFNDAWSDNWGFVPATEAELRKTAQDMKLIIDEDLAYILEIDQKPMGICVCLPNINEAIYDLGGKLFPLGLPKLLWRLKVKHPTGARLMLLGIRRELRGVKRYGALSLAMYVELARRGTGKGYRWGELSWTLEDNTPVNLGIRAMGAKVYKRYRLYERELAQ